MKFLLTGHDARCVDYMHWKGLSNGRLLDAAEKEDFHVVITADRNFQHQQNIAGRRLTLVVLRAHPKTLATLASLVPMLVDLLPRMVAGQVYEI